MDTTYGNDCSSLDGEKKKLEVVIHNPVIIMEQIVGNWITGFEIQIMNVEQLQVNGINLHNKLRFIKT